LLEISGSPRDSAWGALQRSPDAIAGFRGKDPHGKGTENGEEREGHRKE